jgi:hypothetical protein
MLDIAFDALTYRTYRKRLEDIAGLSVAIPEREVLRAVGDGLPASVIDQLSASRPLAAYARQIRPKGPAWARRKAMSPSSWLSCWLWRRRFSAMPKLLISGLLPERAAGRAQARRSISPRQRRGPSDRLPDPKRPIVRSAGQHLRPLRSAGPASFGLGLAALHANLSSVQTAQVIM